MKIYTLEFEKPITELEQTLEALRKQADEQKIDLSTQIQSIEEKLETTKKWLGKSSHANLNIKPAQLALANAEKITVELATLRSRLAEATVAKKVALKSLDAAIERIKAEKRLKAKEAKLQSKLAILTASA